VSLSLEEAPAVAEPCGRPIWATHEVGSGAGRFAVGAKVETVVGPVERRPGWGTNRPPVGALAPGAINMRPRVKVMDTHGVDQTFIFAGGPGVIGCTFIQVSPDRVGWLMGDVHMTQEQLLHYEGGQEPSAQFAERLARFGPEVLEKFFVTNAHLLVP
jgi:hypothetical protein